MLHTGAGGGRHRPWLLRWHRHGNGERVGDGKLSFLRLLLLLLLLMLLLLLLRLRVAVVPVLFDHAELHVRRVRDVPVCLNMRVVPLRPPTVRIPTKSRVQTRHYIAYRDLGTGSLYMRTASSPSIVTRRALASISCTSPSCEKICTARMCWVDDGSGRLEGVGTYLGTQTRTPSQKSRWSPRKKRDGPWPRRRPVLSPPHYVRTLMMSLTMGVSV